MFFKKIVKKWIATFEEILTVRERQIFSIFIGVVIPTIIDFFTSFLFPIQNIFLKMSNLAFEVLLPSMVIYLLWARISYLQSDSETNSLTKLRNRKGMMTAVSEKVFSIQRVLNGLITPSPNFGVVAIDLDNFKKVNDAFGHSAGDEVLIIIADIMNKIFTRLKSGDDINCRIGGDEFISILCNTSLDVTKERATMFCKAVASDTRLHFDGFNITVSVGVSTMHYLQTSKMEDIEVALHNAILEADRAAYLSKKNGKNCVS